MNQTKTGQAESGQMTPEIFYAQPNQLRPHPENMRRVYPPTDVIDMAGSIQAVGGVYQALLVVPDEERGIGHFLVVDGNMRLAGGLHLDEACPPLKCELIEGDRAQQLLTMAVTTAFHFPKDPISEALHYQRLVEAGYSIVEINRHTGVSQPLIGGRLRLLDLDPEIRELVSAGRLSRDKRVADALLTVPEVELRIKLARRLAARNASIQTVIDACAKVVEELASQQTLRAAETPALAQVRDKWQGLSDDATLPWAATRATAAATCARCNIATNHLNRLPEPAWRLVVHAADATCAACNLKDLRSICGGCPAVELINHLVAALAEDKHHER